MSHTGLKRIALRVADQFSKSSGLPKKVENSTYLKLLRDTGFATIPSWVGDRKPAASGRELDGMHGCIGFISGGLVSKSGDD